MVYIIGTIFVTHKKKHSLWRDGIFLLLVLTCAFIEAVPLPLHLNILYVFQYIWMHIMDDKPISLFSTYIVRNHDIVLPLISNNHFEEVEFALLISSCAIHWSSVLSLHLNMDSILQFVWMHILKDKPISLYVSANKT